MRFHDPAGEYPGFHTEPAVSETNGSGGCSGQTRQCFCRQFPNNLGVSAARLVVVYLLKLHLSSSFLSLPPSVPPPTPRLIHLSGMQELDMHY